MKRVWVAYATRERQYLWRVELPDQATISDALVTARQLQRSESPTDEIPWETAPVGIFGELREREFQPAEGDRIELYRPLRNDPRERRRESVRQARKGR